MTAIICPIFSRLQRDMHREFGAAPAGVTELRAERIRREREASERRFQERHGFSPTEPTGPEAA